MSLVGRRAVVSNLRESRRHSCRPMNQRPYGQRWNREKLAMEALKILADAVLHS